MKNILLLILFIFPITLFAQEDAFGPQENDNMVIVTTDTVDQSALNKAEKTLKEQGFTIKEKDLKKGTLSTNAYDFKMGKLTLNVIVALNEIKITGEYESNLAMSSGAGNPKPFKKKISYEGIKGSISKEAWINMDTFANQLVIDLQGSISYAKW